MQYRHVLIALGWYYPQMHRGIVEFARNHHWHLTADLDDPVPRHWDGDGVLTHLGARTELWQSLSRLSAPIVDLTESRPEIELPRVAVDNAAIGAMAAEFFLNRGHKRCAMVHRWNLGVSRRRFEALQSTLQLAGVPCLQLCLQKELKRQVDSRMHRHQTLLAWLKQVPKPIGILAGRDDEAVEVLDACFEAGIRVPEQVSVLGVDNTDSICECLQVSLSSIDNNLEQVGYEGAALLERLMRGEPPPKEPIYVPPKGIVERRSTDAYAVEHPKVAAALRFIQEHSSEVIGVPDIAQAVAMSRSGLEKAFREHYVRAPGEELRRLRLEHVKHLLRTTDKTVLAIALATGFQAPQHLCRSFRQHFKTTPHQFRQQHRR